MCACREFWVAGTASSTRHRPGRRVSRRTPHPSTGYARAGGAEDRAVAADDPAAGDVRVALAEHRERQTIVPLSGLVFTSSKGTALDSRNVTRSLHGHLVRLGLPPQRFHDLQALFRDVGTRVGSRPARGLAWARPRQAFHHRRRLRALHGRDAPTAGRPNGRRSQRLGGTDKRGQRGTEKPGLRYRIRALLVQEGGGAKGARPVTF